MLRSALLAACALATCVDHFAAGVEVLVSEGRVVAPTNWVAAASSPALSAFDGQGDPEPVPSVPGLIALAPGGALRVTRARAFREDGARDPSEDVRAAVVTLGAVPESDPESETSSLRVDVRSVETVEGVVRASFGLGGDEGEESGETKTAVKTVERLVTTACALRRGARGAWEVARDGSERTCTAKRFVAGDASAEESAADDVDATEGVAYATRVEIVLGNLNLKIMKNAMNAEEPERPNATVSKASAVSTKRVVSRRVDEIAVVAVDDDATVPKRVKRIVAKEITLVSRGDLVDLAWSWLARATQCASSVRADIMSQCEFDSTYVSQHVGLSDATFPKETAITVDALVNGCCAAVAAHADAGCACALEVAEGLAPFFFAPASASASAKPLPSAMARSDAVHAAVATLEALCFGGKGDAYDAANLEHDAYDAAKKKPTSCVASSATLAATRAVALEGVTPQDRSEPGTTSGGSTHIAASAFASSSSPSPGTSPEEKEYAAFLRWLDGGANAAADASAGFERTSSGSDHLARDRGSASLGDERDVTNATTRTNATKGGQRKTKTIPSRRVAVVVVVASVVVVALLAAVVVLRRVIAERARLPRRGDGSIERANVCAEHAALALENGDEVRLVARRRAGGGVNGA